jgi:CheY-like chemotaxis protein
MRTQKPIDIIMVQDDAGHARLIEAALRQAGIMHTIHHCIDGTSALAYIAGERQGPALILLDLDLPDIRGEDVLRRIKGEPRLRRMPVVVLTASDDRQAINRCYDLGCNIYMAKPIDHDQLTDAIRQLGLFLAVIQMPDGD